MFLGPGSLWQHEPGFIPTLAPGPGPLNVYQSLWGGGGAGGGVDLSTELPPMGPGALGR